MSNSWDKESQEQCNWFDDLSSSEWEVNMSNKETMNGKVPLSPVLIQISSIPEVTIESSICKFGNFTPHVHIRVEERVEHNKP